MEIVSLLGQSHDEYESPFRDLAESDVAYDARVGEMMLALIDTLRGDPLGVTIHASHHPDIELWLQYSVPDGAHVMISATVDRPDFGPLTDGLPNFHYRLSYRIGDATDRLPTEHRASTLPDAHEFIRDAIVATQNHS